MKRHFSQPPPSSITPEAVFMERRRACRLLGLGALGLAGCGGTQTPQAAQGSGRAAAGTPAARTLHVSSSSDHAGGEAQTRFEDATHYNNYYEFGTDKSDPAANSPRFQPQPWSVEVAGHAESTGRFALDDLMRGLALEERIYRMRCVEAWSMVIPWVGFPLADLLKRFKPTSRAKYVSFTTVERPAQMPGLARRVLDWPYREGLRIDEAMHPLTLLAVGMYGRELPNQNGAPLRLVVPWKYGFKGIKSIVRISFDEQQPRTSWNESAPDEYGFYSNVNPDVDHPRWSQKTERRISGDGFSLFGNRIRTLPFNGYGDQVAGLYAGMDLRRQF